MAASLPAVWLAHITYTGSTVGQRIADVAARGSWVWLKKVLGNDISGSHKVEPWF
jgi:hypothetical protein